MNNLGLAINEAKYVLIPHTKVRIFWRVIIDTVRSRREANGRTVKLYKIPF
jgi:hypothetical protein